MRSQMFIRLCITLTWLTGSLSLDAALWLDTRQASGSLALCVFNVWGGGTRRSMKKVTPGATSATCNVVAGVRTVHRAPAAEPPAAPPTHTRASLLARLHCRDAAARLPAAPQPSPSRATAWVVPRGATVRFLPWAMAGRVPCTRTYLTSAM